MMLVAQMTCLDTQSSNHKHTHCSIVYLYYPKPSYTFLIIPLLVYCYPNSRQVTCYRIMEKMPVFFYVFFSSPEPLGSKVSL